MTPLPGYPEPENFQAFVPQDNTPLPDRLGLANVVMWKNTPCPNLISESNMLAWGDEVNVNSQGTYLGACLIFNMIMMREFGINSMGNGYEYTGVGDKPLSFNYTPSVDASVDKWGDGPWCGWEYPLTAKAREWVQCYAAQQAVDDMANIRQPMHGATGGAPLYAPLEGKYIQDEGNDGDDQMWMVNIDAYVHGPSPRAIVKWLTNYTAPLFYL